MNLLLLEPGERLLYRADPRFRHITRILRLDVGDTIRAGEHGGSVGVATLVTIESGTLELSFAPEGSPRSLAPVTLLLGHPRPIVLKRMLRDLSTIGVERILVVPTENGEQSYRESNLWNDTTTPLREGAAQGGSTLTPDLRLEDSLTDALRGIDAPTETRFVLHAESDREAQVMPSLSHAIGSATSHVGRESTSPAIAVAVGSERGWTPFELDLLLTEGFIAVHAGPRILRTETAAVIAAWCAVSASRGKL